MIIDNSQLTRFQECPRLYQYQIIEGLKFPGYPEGPFSIHLVHAPLADLYRAGGSGSPDAGFRPDWLKYWERFISELPPPEGHPELPPVIPGHLTLDVAQRIYQRYVQQFSSDFDQLEILGVEIVLTIPQIPGFVVKPDLVIRDRLTGLVFPMDWKISKWEKPLILYDRQFLAQIIGVAEMPGNNHTDSRFVRNFFQLGKDDWVREEVIVPMDLVQEWIEETSLDVKMMRDMIASGVYPKRSTQCHKGRWECPAKALCEAGELRREVMKNWPRVENPLAYLEE